MEVEHLFSYPLHSELWNHGLVTPAGIVIADEQELLQYKDFLEEKQAERARETYKLRKNVVNEVQELLKEEYRTPRQDKELSSYLKCLGLDFAEDGFLVLQSEKSLPKKHLGAKEPTWSVMERQVIEEDQRAKILTRDLMTLDEWLTLIGGSNSRVIKPTYSKTVDWKALERKCRERNRKRMNEMEIKRRNKINNFDMEHDRTWRKMLAKTLPPKTMPSKKIRSEIMPQKTISPKPMPQKTISPKTMPHKTIPTQKGFAETPSIKTEVTSSTSFTSISETVPKDKMSHVSFPKGVRKETATPKKISKKELENSEKVQIDGGKQSLESQKIQGIRKKKMSPGVHESKGLKLHDIEEKRRKIRRQRLELFERIVDKRTGVKKQKPVKKQKQQERHPKVKRYDKETYEKIRDAKYDEKTDKRPHFMRKKDIETKVDEAEKSSQKQSDEAAQKGREWEILHKKEHEKPILKDISKDIKDKPQEKEIDDTQIQVQSNSFEYPVKKFHSRKDAAVDQKIEDFLKDVMQCLDKKKSLEIKDSVKIDKHQKPKVEHFAEKKIKDCSQRSIVGNRLKKPLSADTPLKFQNQEELPIKESSKSSLKDFTTDQTEDTEKSLQMLSVLERDHVKPKALNLTKSQERDKLDDNMFENTDNTEDEKIYDTQMKSNLSDQSLGDETFMSSVDHAKPSAKIKSLTMISTIEVVDDHPKIISPQSLSSEDILSPTDTKDGEDDFDIKSSYIAQRDDAESVPDKATSGDETFMSSVDHPKPSAKIKSLTMISTIEVVDDYPKIISPQSLSSEDIISPIDTKDGEDDFDIKSSYIAQRDDAESVLDKATSGLSRKELSKPQECVPEDYENTAASPKPSKQFSMPEVQDDRPGKTPTNLPSDDRKSHMNSQDRADELKMELSDFFLMDKVVRLDKKKSDLSDIEILGNEAYSDEDLQRTSSEVKTPQRMSSIEVVNDHPKIISPQSLISEDIISSIDTKDGEDDFDMKSSYIAQRDDAESVLDKATSDLSKELSKPQEYVPEDYEKTAASQKPSKQFSMPEVQDDRPGKTPTNLPSDDRKSQTNSQDRVDELKMELSDFLLMDKVVRLDKNKSDLSDIEILGNEAYSDEDLQRTSSDGKTPRRMSSIEVIDDFPKKISYSSLSLEDMTSSRTDEVNDFGVQPSTFTLGSDNISVLDKILSGLSEKEISETHKYLPENSRKASIVETPKQFSITELKDDRLGKTISSFPSDDIKFAINSQDEADELKQNPSDFVDHVEDDVISVLDKLKSGVFDIERLGDKAYSNEGLQQTYAEVKTTKRDSSTEVIVGLPERISHQSEDVISTTAATKKAYDFQIKPSHFALSDDARSVLNNILPGLSAEEFLPTQKFFPENLESMTTEISITEVQDDRPDANELLRTKKHSAEDFERTPARVEKPKQISISEDQDDKTLYGLSSDDTKSHVEDVDDFKIKPSDLVVKNDAERVFDKIKSEVSTKKSSFTDTLSTDNLKETSSTDTTPKRISTSKLPDDHSRRLSHPIIHSEDVKSDMCEPVQTDDFTKKPPSYSVLGDEEKSVQDKMKSDLSAKEFSTAKKYSARDFKSTSSSVQKTMTTSIKKIKYDHPRKSLPYLSSKDLKSPAVRQEDADDDFMIKPPDTVLRDDVERVLDKVISDVHEKQSLGDETYSAHDSQKVSSKLKTSKRISSLELLIGRFDRLSLHRCLSVDGISSIGREEADDFKLEPSQNLLRDDTKSELDLIKSCLSAKEFPGYKKHSAEDFGRMSARTKTPANASISEVQDDSLITMQSGHPPEDMESSIDSKEESADFELKLTDSFIRDDIKCTLEKMKSDRSAKEFPEINTYSPEEHSTSKVLEDIQRIISPPNLEHKSLINISDKSIKSSESAPFTAYTKYFAAARDELAERSSSIPLTGESSRDISESQSGQQQKLRKNISKVASKGKRSSKKDITDKVTKSSQDQTCKLKSSRSSKSNFNHADEMKRRVSELGFKDDRQLKRGSVETDRPKYDLSKTDIDQMKEDLGMAVNEDSLPSPTIEVLGEMFEKRFSLDDKRKITSDAKDASDVSEKVCDASRKDKNRVSSSESSKIKISESRKRISISLLGDKVSAKTKSGDKKFPITDEGPVVDLSKEHTKTSKIVVQKGIDISKLDKHDESAEEPTSPDSQKQMHAYFKESEAERSDYIQSSSLDKGKESKTKLEKPIKQEDPMSSDDSEYRETKPSAHASHFRSTREKPSIENRLSQLAKKDSPKQTSLKKHKDGRELMEKKTDNQKTELKGYKDTSKFIPKVKRRSPTQQMEEGAKNVRQSPKAEPQPGTSESDLQDAESPRPVSAARGSINVWPFKQDISDVANILIEKTQQMKANKGLQLNKALYKNLDESEKTLPKRNRWKELRRLRR